MACGQVLGIKGKVGPHGGMWTAPSLILLCRQQPDVACQKCTQNGACFNSFSRKTQCDEWFMRINRTRGIYCPLKPVPACQGVHLQGEWSQNPLLSFGVQSHSWLHACSSPYLAVCKHIRLTSQAQEPFILQMKAWAVGHLPASTDTNKAPFCIPPS